jgi:hypothetical protein
MLLKMLVGSDDENIFKRPFFSPIDIWMQIKHYFAENDIFVNLHPLSFNIAQTFGDSSKKISMIEDMEDEIKDSVYNFIYRLLCGGTNPVNQFTDIKEALNHKFIKVLTASKQKALQKRSEAWNTHPADY